MKQTILLENNADLESRDDHGRTPLSLASEEVPSRVNPHEQEAVVSLLHVKGADIRGRRKAEMALHGPP
jgi:ankyrin repeat protein